MINRCQGKDEKKIVRKGNEKGIDEDKVENMTETSKAGMEEERKEIYHEDEIKKERTNFINSRKQKREENARRRISEGE